MATVLVVDDDRLIRTTLENCLRNAGHAAILATNGREAIELLKTLPLDAVILDMNMPEIDGWTTALWIRKELGDQIPIIAYSAYKLEGDQARAKTAGCSHFLPKPIDVGIFMKTLTEAMKSE